jgi:hypothetical protein
MLDMNRFVPLQGDGLMRQQLLVVFAVLAVVVVSGCESSIGDRTDLGIVFDVLNPPQDARNDRGLGFDLGPGTDPGFGSDTSNDPGTGTDPGTGIDSDPLTDPGVETDPGVDTDTGSDLVLPTSCTGACDPASDSVMCLADGTTMCFCDEDAGAWDSLTCGEVCTYYGMAGDQCIPGDDGPTCDCSYDCTDAVGVAAQCENASYTPCTCAAADPCQWAGDDYCDIACAEVNPEDYFDDSGDCNCEGTCDANSFSGYCMGDGVCVCGEGGNQTIEDCVALCATIGAGVSADGACTGGYCNCDNYDCGQTDKVLLQCDYGIYTPCTCDLADPCSWNGDEYCDYPTCLEMFPEQSSFDDTAVDC